MVIEKKRRLLWALLTILIAALTLWAVFAQSGTLSPADLIAALEQASPAWLGATVLCMAGFIVFEGLSLLCILRNLDCPRGFFQGLLYSAGDQFFSAITPSATGGQPASALFMRKHGVPGAVITAALLLNLVLYTAATLTIGAVCFLLRPEVFARFDPLSKCLVIFGMAVLIVLAVLFIGLLKKGDVLDRLGRRLFRLLHRLRLMRNPDRWCRRLDGVVSEYKLCAAEVAGKSPVLIKVYCLDLAQRVSQISVTVTLHAAMGGSLKGVGADLWAVQALAQIGSTCVPIPGGMGAADYLMLDGFQRLFSGEYAFQLQILSRGFSFYICTLLSGLIVLAGVLAIRFRTRREKER